HPIDFCGILEALHVDVEPEARGSFRRGIAPGALEHAAAVMDDVRRNVNLRILPVDQLAIHPHRTGAGKSHQFSFTLNSIASMVSTRWSNCTLRHGSDETDERKDRQGRKERLNAKAAKGAKAFPFGAS